MAKYLHLLTIPNKNDLIDLIIDKPKRRKQLEKLLDSERFEEGEGTFRKYKNTFPFISVCLTAFVRSPFKQEWNNKIKSIMNHRRFIFYIPTSGNSLDSLEA
jgi:hypothetical protein